MLSDFFMIDGISVLCYNSKKQAKNMINMHEPGFYVLSCINIDNFKVINAQHGTETGDGVIRHVASSINNCMNEIGGICAHIAGDEFAALYPMSYIKSKAIDDGHLKASEPDCIFQRIRLRVGRFVIDEPILPADYDKAMEAAERVVRTKQPETYEFRCRKRNGEIVWVQITNSVVDLDGIGDNVLIGVAMDVTDLHSLKEAAASTADKLLNLTHADDRENVRKAVSAAIRTGENSEIVYRIVRPGGDTAWIKASVSTTQISGIENPVQITIFSDITAEKKYIEKLHQYLSNN